MARGDGGESAAFDLEGVTRASSDDFSDLAEADLVTRLRNAERELAESKELSEQLTRLAGKLMTVCRECRSAPADFIIWGKLFPEEALGPKCWECASKHVGSATLSDVGHEGRHPAIVDLQPYNRLFGRYDR